MFFRALTEADTVSAGEKLGRELKKGAFIALYGDLGAGKTAFVRGLAKGLGSDADVSSPTFALMHEYLGGRLPLYHFDLYRIRGEEIYSLGFDEYFYDSECVCAVEWCERLGPEELPKDALRVRIEKEDGTRLIDISSIKGEAV